MLDTLRNKHDETHENGFVKQVKPITQKHLNALELAEYIDNHITIIEQANALAIKIYDQQIFKQQ